MTILNCTETLLKAYFRAQPYESGAHFMPKGSQESFDKYTDAINQIFARRFDEVYKTAHSRNRTKVLPFISNIYRRWLYSAWAENSYLTPANLHEALR